MPCEITGLEPYCCSHCRRPGDFITRGPKNALRDDMGRRMPKPPSKVKPKVSKPDATTIQAQRYMLGLTCFLCGHERLGEHGLDAKNSEHPRKGMCRCERLDRFAREVSEIETWADRLEAEGRKAGRWPAMQALRRSAIAAGRYEPAEFLGEAMPLIAVTGLEARGEFSEPARWTQSRGGVADELPIY